MGFLTCWQLHEGGSHLRGSTAKLKSGLGQNEGQQTVFYMIQDPKNCANHKQRGIVHRSHQSARISHLNLTGSTPVFLQNRLDKSAGLCSRRAISDVVTFAD